MAGTVIRRPLPALISLLALLLLTGIVWWRVLNRDSGTDDAAGCPTPTPTPSQMVLPAPASITLQVLNSTKRNGIAAKARRSLLDAGFKVPAQAGNDNPKTKSKNTGTAQIRFGPTGERAATLVRYYFPGAAMVPTASKSSTVIVALGAKYKKVAAPATVAAALKGDKISVASTAPASPTASAGVNC